MNEHLQKLRGEFRTYLGKMSSREWGLIFVVCSALLVILTIEIVNQIGSFFEAQSQRLAQLEERLGHTTTSLQKYLDLKARLDAIETRYREVAIQEGISAHLEELIKTKAGIQQGLFTIKDSPAIPFGGDYEQVPLAVKFNTTNLAALVDFLREVTEGSKALILSRLDLNRRRNADRLDVEISLSGIRRK